MTEILFSHEFVIKRKEQIMGIEDACINLGCLDQFNSKGMKAMHHKNFYNPRQQVTDASQWNSKSLLKLLNPG